MDIDPEGNPPHDEPVPVRRPVTAPTAFGLPAARNGRRSSPFALLGIMTVGTGLAAFFAVRESSAVRRGGLGADEFTAVRVCGHHDSQSRSMSPEVRTTITSEGVTSFDTAATTRWCR